MANGNRFAVLRKFRKELRKTIFQRKPPLLNQNKHGHGRELLRQGSETEICVCCARNFLLQIGKAIAFGKDRFAVPDHHDSGAGRVCLVKIVKQCIDDFFIGLAHRVETQRKDCEEGKQTF